MHMPICKAGIFPSGLIKRNSSTSPLPPDVLRSTGFTPYSIPFKFNAMRTRHAHELRQDEYNNGCIEADIMLKIIIIITTVEQLMTLSKSTKKEE